MFLNTTETDGVLIGQATTTSTGDMFITLLLLMLFLFSLCLMFKIRLEWSAIILLPYILACGVYYSQFVAMIGTIFIYLSVILVKNWIFK